MLVFANKQDIYGSMTDKEIEQASQVFDSVKSFLG